MHAGNRIGDDGAASLAPSLERMTQLTSLDFSGTLRSSAAAALRAGACECRQCVHDAACCGLGRLRAGLERVVGIARGEPRGGGACRQLDRR